MRKLPLTPEFGWNVKAARYVDIKTGRFIKNKVVRDAVDKVVENASNRLTELAQTLMRGGIDLEQWELRTAEELKLLHLANYTAARGGWAQLTSEDIIKVQSILVDQLRYLHRFAVDIASGKQPLGPGLVSRIELYAGAGRATYEAVRTQVMIELGYEFERSVLHLADHCAGCLDAASQGWSPIGTIVPIGSRDCLTRCRCTLEYRRTEEN